jgi:glycosyltransferase involved in cell wall biosynthesis
MKIAILIPQFPGQTHAFFWREIKHLERLGAEVHLFSTRRPKASLVSHSWADEAASRTTYLNIGRPLEQAEAVLRLPAIIKKLRALERGSGALKSAIVSAPAAVALLHACRARGIDHVHAHSAANSAMIAAISKALGGPNYSVTLHGALNGYGPGQLFKWAGARFGFAVSQQNKNELVQRLGDLVPRPLFVCPMGVDSDHFKPATPYVPWSGEEPLRIFSCARLNAGKGHDTVIGALVELKKAGVTAHLKIAGEDDDGGSGYRKTLETAIEAAAIGDQVELLGAVNESTVIAHLQDAHLFVLASRNEALGVAYMEAMACGCPTIGTDVGGVPELISNGQDGILVPPNDVAALADAILRLAKDQSLATALAAAGRQRVVSAFGSHRSAEALATAIETVRVEDAKIAAEPQA